MTPQIVSATNLLTNIGTHPGKSPCTQTPWNVATAMYLGVWYTLVDLQLNYKCRRLPRYVHHMAIKTFFVQTMGVN